MRLLAAFSAAVLAYLVVGALVGVRPTRRADRRTSAPGRRRLGEWLASSGTDVAPTAFVGVIAGSALAAVALVVLVTGVPILAALAGVLGAVTPVVLIDRRRAALSAARRAGWPDALRDVATRLRSGASVHAALVDLGRLGPPPLRSTFVRYDVLAGALDHRVALETIRGELADPLADRVIEVLLVAFDQGTRVVIDILDDLADAAVADLQLSADIETAQLENTLEARGAALLPFVVLGLLCLGSDGYRQFYAGTAGTFVVIVGLVMSVVGLGLIARLGRVEAEPRTLVEGGRV